MELQNVANAFDGMNTCGSAKSGSKYECNPFENVQQRFIHYPKEVLANVNKIREFSEPQKYLYYYLLWNCKLARIDKEFIHFCFKDAATEDIGVYNCELHDKRTNAQLFVVAKFTKKGQTFKGRPPLWTMDRLMTARQLFAVYGIDECDLPKGSRAKRNSFSAQITMHYQKLHRLVHVNDWSTGKVEIVPNRKGFDMNIINGIDLNEAIRHSIEQIKDEDDELELIPILTIRPEHVYCDVLIPIQVNDGKWFAVSYKTSTIRPYKATVTGLYVDAEDILCKASLVDANAVTAYDYILPPAEVDEDEKESEEVGLSLIDNLSGDTNASTDTDHSMSSSSLSMMYRMQCELHESVKRERIMLEEFVKAQSSSPPNSSGNVGNINMMPPIPRINPISPMFVSPIPPIHIQTPSIASMQPAHSAPPILNLNLPRAPAQYQQVSPVVNATISAAYASFNSYNFQQQKN